MRLELMTVSELALVRSGGGAPQDANAFTATGHPFVRAGSLPKLLDGADEEDLEKLETATAAEYGLTLFPAGTVLFAKSGMSATKGYVYRLRRPAYIVNHLAALIPRAADDSAFLVRVLQRFPPTVLIKDPAYPSIRLGDIEDMKVLAPSVPTDRRRIAEVLDRAEALRAKRRAAFAKLDTLAQAILLDMFGDPAANPKGWRRRTLGDLITVGPQNGLYKPAGDYGSGTPILRIDAFYAGVVTKLASLKRVRLSADEQALYALREGEIVINRVNSREYLGKSALIPALRETTVFESNMMRFDVDRGTLDPGYLIEYLQTSFVRRHILRSAKDAVNQSSINQQDVKTLPVVVPTLRMQHLFTRQVAAIERLKAAHRASLAEMDALFASLQHRAFRGEL
jgi:type I restriction enzyme S subunit